MFTTVASKNTKLYLTVLATEQVGAPLKVTVYLLSISTLAQHNINLAMVEAYENTPG